MSLYRISVCISSDKDIPVSYLDHLAAIAAGSLRTWEHGPIWHGWERVEVEP